MRGIAWVLLALMMVACEGMFSPTPIPSPGPTPEPDPSSPPLYKTEVTRNGRQLFVNGEPMRIFAAFSAVLAGPDYMARLCTRARSRGFNTARILESAPHWSGWLVPFAFDRQRLVDVIEALDGAGCAVELILVEEHKVTGNLLRAKSRVNRILDKTRGKKNVIYSIANEYRAGRIDVQGIRELLELVRKRTNAGFVGVDESSPRPGVFETAAFGHNGRLVDFCAWHPPRNIPEVEEASYYWRGAMHCGAKPVLYDELVAYATDENLERFPRFVGNSLIALNGRGTDKERRAYVRKVQRACEESRAHCGLNSINLILLQEQPETIWFPAKT